MKQRILSVDIFRGLTIALMILVNTPGTWRAVYAPFLHAEWHGYTPTDLVFPFFLFIVGTSIVFAYRNKQPDASTYKKIGVRVLKLIGLGIFLGAFTVKWPFFEPFSEIRFPGVLQRIGVVFGIAALLYLHTNWKTLLGIAITLLLGYWVWMGFIPLDGQAPTFERAANNWANYIDLNVFGTHMYKDDYDPEGLLSTLPSIVTSILGIFTGMLLVSETKDKLRKMLLMGVGLLVLGTLWDFVFPINKALWTSSFVLVTAGWANLVLGLIYYITDVKGISFGSIFRYAGSNAITVYFLSSFVTSLFYQIQVGEGQSIHGWLFNTLYVHDFMALELSSLLYALSVMGFYLLVGWWMYRKGIFIKV
ncbi:acyltransferase family protein [Robiginitalea sediminis]|uniref:acyltransferase family protein n=1 Tax=Robiginitalea sediminis TaxID=1982593 RepID=UPI000B4BEC16|nr:heparan-alpha-glucosaminide N-acetyltransferase domain-containing protein [Robiginitalea sediminis]